MSTYSSNLRIELITNGTQAGTWGDTTNNNLAYVLDSSIAGYQTVSVTAANQALTYTSGPTSTASANQAVYAMLRFTTTTGAAFAVYAPPVSKAYIVWNNSGYSMTIYNSTVIGNTTAAGTGITVANGDKVFVWSDATNFYEIKSGSVTGVVPIVNGGTGQITANAALNALLPAQTNNRVLRSDGTNTSFAQVALTTDISGTLPVANGGTGQSNANAAFNALAPSQASANGNYLKSNGTNTSWDQIDISTSDITGTLPVANGGTGLTTPGTSGYVLTSNGTAWVSSPAGAATGGGSDQAFFLNDLTITTDYTIPSTRNAGTFGPITVNTGVTVTVSTGATWTVV